VVLKAPLLRISASALLLHLDEEHPTRLSGFDHEVGADAKSSLVNGGEDVSEHTRLVLDLVLLRVKATACGLKEVAL
jgi:hypothetical protein